MWSRTKVAEDFEEVSRPRRDRLCSPLGQGLDFARGAARSPGKPADPRASGYLRKATSKYGINVNSALSSRIPAPRQLASTPLEFLVGWEPARISLRQPARDGRQPPPLEEKRIPSEFPYWGSARRRAGSSPEPICMHFQTCGCRLTVSTRTAKAVGETCRRRHGQRQETASGAGWPCAGNGKRPRSQKRHSGSGSS